MNLIKDTVTIAPVLLLTATTVVGVGILIGISAWGPR